MDSNRIEGKADQARGKLRQWWGRLTGQPGQQARGHVEQGVGKVKESYGRLKDELRAEEQRRDESRGPGREEPLL